MFKNSQEEINFFAVNENLTCSVKNIYKDYKIGIVDNFYKNPKQIQKLALEIPPTFKKNIASGIPGGRVAVSYNFDFLAPIFNQLINDIYMQDTIIFNCQEQMEHATFCVNVTSQTESLPNKVPHIDGMEGFAVGIFLNDDKDCIGGTSFYTYKKNIAPTTYPDGDLSIENYPGYIMEDYKDFKKVYLAEMKFNRMIIYPKKLLHTAYIPDNSFDCETPRLIQMFFI
mgnify:CR=1 FL=1